jgi:hypothetical protein
MDILAELIALFSEMGVPAQTEIFASPAPDTFALLTPLGEEFTLFADEMPHAEIQSVRIGIYCKENYGTLAFKVSRALMARDFTITDRLFIEREDKTKLYHYNIDVEKHYTTEF